MRPKRNPNQKWFNFSPTRQQGKGERLIGVQLELGINGARPQKKRVGMPKGGGKRQVPAIYEKIEWASSRKLDPRKILEFVSTKPITGKQIQAQLNRLREKERKSDLFKTATIKPRVRHKYPKKEFATERATAIEAVKFILAYPHHPSRIDFSRPLHSKGFVYSKDLTDYLVKSRFCRNRQKASVAIGILVDEKIIERIPNAGLRIHDDFIIK